METRQNNTNKFDLEPMLRAARAQDEVAMRAFIKQGYSLSKRDSVSHKTLLFILGEELDLETIRFIEKLYDHRVDLKDAVKGAAFANHKLDDIEKITDLRLEYQHAYYGAAKGRNHELLGALRERVKGFGENYEYMNIHFIVSGAAEVNDQKTISEYTSYHYREHCSDLLLSSYIRSAAYGGHTAVVEQLLQKHHLWDKNAITESGYSIAYREAMHGAAQAGNIGLIAKLFLHVDEQARPMEHPLDLISSTIKTAAYHGHNDLVFDLIGRAKLYLGSDVKDNDYTRILISALSGALSRGRYELAVALCSYGLKPEDIVKALVNHRDKPRAYEKLFKALNNAKLCYEIAHYQNTQKHNRCKTDLIPVANKIYGIETVSKEATTLFCENETLRVWLANYQTLPSKFTQTIEFMDADPGKLVAEYVTGHQISNTAFAGACYLTSKLDSGTHTPKAKPAQAVTDKIRKRILDEINLYLKTKLIYHRGRAKALYSCTRKLNCIESIYLLIKHQIAQMNAKPATAQPGKARTALRKLATTPTRTGHSLFSNPLKHYGSLDFLSRLENCLAIIEEYKSEDRISSILSDSSIYDKPSFSGFPSP